MKRIIAALIAITLCVAAACSALAEFQVGGVISVGGSVIFGSYEQDNNTENGKEPLEWVVLDVNGSEALLLSKYCIDARAYNTDFVRMTWNRCTLRAWLNSDFIENTFTAEESTKIVEKTISNPDNKYYGTTGGPDTTDKVFLLSLDETEAYFPNVTDRQAKPTAYAIARGVYVDDATGYTWWWLRSPGVRPIDASGVRVNGNISGYGSRDVYRPSGALRPVLWLNLAN